MKSEIYSEMLMINVNVLKIGLAMNEVPFTQFKNMKSTHGGVLFLVKLQALNVTLLHCCFSHF